MSPKICQRARVGTHLNRPDPPPPHPPASTPPAMSYYTRLSQFSPSYREAPSSKISLHQCQDFLNRDLAPPAKGHAFLPLRQKKKKKKKKRRTRKSTFYSNLFLRYGKVRKSPWPLPMTKKGSNPRREITKES